MWYVVVAQATAWKRCPKLKKEKALEHNAPRLWRRKRDSNPRGFWPNGFQDRLVVTASIFLHIYGVVYYTIYTQFYFDVACETRFTNPLRIPREDASSSLVSSESGYPRQIYSCDVVNHRTNYLILDITLHVRNLVKLVSRIRFAYQTKTRQARL